MKAVLFYLLWVVLVGVCAAVARWLELPLLAVLGMAMTAGALVLWWLNRRRSAATARTALWISQRGQASGYHHTDKLTPDGVLAGFDHDDFTPGSRETYRTTIPLEQAAAIFERLRSPQFRALAGRYADPLIVDGHTLRITWRLDGVEKTVWLSNTEQELLSPLVAEVCSLRPPKATCGP